MAWAALGFLVLGVVLCATAIQVGGNARAPDEQIGALISAIVGVVSLLTAVVLGVLAAFG